MIAHRFAVIDEGSREVPIVLREALLDSAAEQRLIECSATILPLATSSCKQGRGAVPLVIVVGRSRRVRSGASSSLRPLQHLDRRYLIDTENNRLGGRVDIETDHVGRFRRELRVAALAAGLAGGQIDVVLAQEAPNILNVNILQRIRQQRTRQASQAAAADPEAPECACSSPDLRLASSRPRAIVSSGRSPPSGFSVHYPPHRIRPVRLRRSVPRASPPTTYPSPTPRSRQRSFRPCLAHRIGAASKPMIGKTMPPFADNARLNGYSLAIERVLLEELGTALKKDRPCKYHPGKLHKPHQKSIGGSKSYGNTRSYSIDMAWW